MKSFRRSRTKIPHLHKKKKKYIAPGRRVLRFPQVKGKRLAEVEFSTYSGNHSIALRFEDKTELRFGIEPGFTMYADYADWKTGNHRLIREWRAIRSKILRE